MITRRHGVLPLLAAAVLAASCAVVSPGTPTPSATADPWAQGRMTPPVPNPRDARGIPPCDLLTPAQLIELNLRPDSAQPYESGAAVGCGWGSDPPGDVLSIQENTQTTLAALEGMYMTRPTARNFQETQVAGYPAVRSDLVKDECLLYLAIADHQGIAAGGDIANNRYPGDPCSLARHTLELILSNLPPLR